MATQRVWNFSPGETRDLAVSMASELDPGASMTGETPTVSAWTLSGTVYSAATGFTFASEAVNTAQLAIKNDAGETIETVAIGEGIEFRCTSPSSTGTYYIRTECDADDGTHVVRWDKLVVSGPGAPA